MTDELERLRAERLKKLMDRKAEVGSGKPVTVTDATLPDILSRHNVVVLDCWAPWCQPCRMIAPVVEALARDYAGRAVFAKLNVDENQATAGQHKVMSIPTLLYFKDGRLSDRVTGALPRQTLESKLRGLL